jgi:hypothetical protein
MNDYYSSRKNSKPSNNSTITAKHNRNISTITMGDFMRIRDNIIPSTTGTLEQKSRDEHLRTLSQNRINSWTDSIQNSKKQKLLEKKKNYIENEIQKRKIEEEERRLNEAQKMVVLERANKILFDAQDQVKLFHGKMYFSDVLKEREYQQEITRMKKETQDKIDKKWIELEKEKMKAYDEREKEKIRQDKEKLKHQMECITTQFKEYKVKKIMEYQDQVVEGQVIKRQAIEALEKEK